MKDGVKSIIVLVVICTVVSLAVAVTNSFTAPIIKEQTAQGEIQSLTEVLPGSKDFEKADRPQGAPDSIKDIYKETSGLGYAVTMSVTSQYSQGAMLYTVGVGADGKITGIRITSYNETKDFGDYPQSYVGKDSALNGVDLYGGVTYSSAAFKQGIEDMFNTLVDAGYIGEGQKSDEQKLADLIPKILPGCVNQSGKAVVTEYQTDFENADKAYKAENGVGYVLYLKNKTVIAVNAFGEMKGYDLDGNTAEINFDEYKNIFPVNSQADGERDLNSIKILSDKAWQRVDSYDGFGTVTNVFSADGYYGFVCHPVGYNDGTMTVWGIVNPQGETESIKCDEFILHSQYYDKEFDEEWLYSQYTGKTEVPEDVLISGATVSSNALKNATKDMLEAFERMVETGK